MLRFIRYIKTNLIALPLIRFAYKLDLFIFKRALKLLLLLDQKLKLRTRYVDPNARLEGYYEDFDLLVNLASLRLLNTEILDDRPPGFLFKDLPEDVKKVYSERKSEYLSHKSEVENLVEKIEKDEEVTKIIVSYNLVKHFSANYLKNRKAAEYYLSKALKLDPEASALSTNDLFVLERSLRKDINRLTNEIADRQAIKISLSIERAGPLISLVSCFFLISGYLYNRFLLGYFGVEVSKYFTLSDYLASSIEGLRYSATGAAIGLAAYFMGAHLASRKSYAQIEYERKRREYLPYFLVFTAIAGTILGYINNSEMFYEAGFALIIFTILLFAPLLAIKYFKEPLVALFMLAFVASYSAHMFSSIGKAIYRAKNYPFEQIQQYDVKFKKGLPINESHLALIAGNSNYLFFLNRERNAFIIPRDQILYLKGRKIEDKKPNKALPSDS